MGQHKYNPIAIAAKNGDFPPKPQKMSKREAERILYAKCAEILYKPLIDAHIKMQSENFVEEEKSLKDKRY